MIKGIFFDLFGTLFIYGDMQKSWADWLHGLYTPLVEEAGLTCTKDIFAQHCNGFFAEDKQPPYHPNLTLYERRLHALCQVLDIQPSTATFNRAISESIQPWQNHVPLDPKAIPILQKLKTQYTLGLISNFDHAPYVHALLQEHNLTPLFKTIVVSGDIEINKPDPEIFHRALNQVHLSPHETIYVGDNPIDDIQGALGVGMSPIWIRRTKDPKQLDYQTNDQPTQSSPPNVPPTVPVISQLPQLFDHLPTAS